MESWIMEQSTGNGTGPARRRIQLLTIPEVAARMRVSEAKAWALVGSGRLESVKIDRSRRVPEDAVDDYLLGLIEQEQARRAGSAA
jgi:excisionase family DNA binding protein